MIADRFRSFLHKPRALFFLVAFYIAAFFSWWTYSLVNSSKIIYTDEKKLLIAQSYQARSYLLTAIANGELESQDAVEAAAEERFNNHELEYAEHATLLTEFIVKPKPTVYDRLEKERKRKVTMYISEGVALTLLLFWGLLWIYRSLSARIRLNQQQNNFLLSVTHELKTPLSSIKLYLQTLQKRALEKEKAEQVIQNSLKDVDRLNDLVENVLLATKMETSRYEYIKQPVNLSNITTEVVERTRHQSAARKILIQTLIEPDLVFKGDELSLKLAVSNLIENAVKYAPQDTSVEVELSRKEQKMVLQVRDYGVGIPEEEQKHIFKKFYRIGDESTRRTKGTGLGLYIVKQVVERHSGSIRLFSNNPSGSVFEVVFHSNS